MNHSLLEDKVSCKAGLYNNSDIVRMSRGLVCYGGFGQPPCQYLLDCIEEQGGKVTMRVRKGKSKMTIKFSQGVV